MQNPGSQTSEQPPPSIAIPTDVPDPTTIGHLWHEPRSRYSRDKFFDILYKCLRVNEDEETPCRGVREILRWLKNERQPEWTEPEKGGFVFNYTFGQVLLTSSFKSVRRYADMERIRSTMRKSCFTEGINTLERVHRNYCGIGCSVAARMKGDATQYETVLCFGNGLFDTTVGNIVKDFESRLRSCKSSEDGERLTTSACEIGLMHHFKVFPLHKLLSLLDKILGAAIFSNWHAHAIYVLLRSMGAVFTMRLEDYFLLQDVTERLRGEVIPRYRDAMMPLIDKALYLPLLKHCADMLTDCVFEFATAIDRWAGVSQVEDAQPTNDSCSPLVEHPASSFNIAAWFSAMGDGVREMFANVSCCL